MSSNSQIGRNAQLLYNTVFAVKVRPLKHTHIYTNKKRMSYTS